MTKEEFDARILKIVQAEVHPSVALDTRLVDDGILDSFHTLKLITRLEDEFGIRLELSEVTAEDVADVISISGLVQRMRAAARSSDA